MRVLDANKHPECICWSYSGESFQMLPNDFSQEALDQDFQGTKVQSLLRKLSRWGFRRALDEGSLKDSFVFRHDFFKKGRPELLCHMKPLPNRSNTHRSHSTPKKSPSHAAVATLKPTPPSPSPPSKTSSAPAALAEAPLHFQAVQAARKEPILQLQRMQLDRARVLEKLLIIQKAQKIREERQKTEAALLYTAKLQLDLNYRKQEQALQTAYAVLSDPLRNLAASLLRVTPSSQPPLINGGSLGTSLSSTGTAAINVGSPSFLPCTGRNTRPIAIESPISLLSHSSGVRKRSPVTGYLQKPHKRPRGAEMPTATVATVSKTPNTSPLLPLLPRP